MHRKLVDATIGCLGYLRLIHPHDYIRVSLAPSFNAVKTFLCARLHSNKIVKFSRPSSKGGITGIL